MRYLNSRESIIALSLIFITGGIAFILMTGRYELSLFIAAAILPWVEHWSKRRKR